MSGTCVKFEIAEHCDFFSICSFTILPQDFVCTHGQSCA